MAKKKIEEEGTKEVKKTSRKVTPRKKTNTATKNVRGKKKTDKDNAVQEPVAETENVEIAAAPVVETPVEAEVKDAVETQAPEQKEAPEAVKAEEEKPAEPQPAEQPVREKPQEPKRQEPKPLPPVPTMRIDSIVDLVNAPHRQLLLNDQQIQQLSVEEAQQRFRWIEGTLAWVFDYDVVISDTNIWIELLVGHTSSHSDPKVNARLMYERQLDFLSKLTRHRRARFMMMSETYEEIDRFATAQSPTNYQDADFTDEALCRNVAARLAKRLILSMQRENRLKIEAIGAESHHSSFADPAIIRKTVELFAEGKKVLLITNDASVGIRSIGMCDDLQRSNNIDDDTWEDVYTPLRPMVMTMDDLKVLDNYTRQYHFMQMAAGKSWMEDVPQRMEKRTVPALSLWMEGFRPGDKHAENKAERDRERQKQKQNQQQKQAQKPAQPQQPQAQAQQNQQQSQPQKPAPKQQKQPQADAAKPQTDPVKPQAEAKNPQVEPAKPQEASVNNAPETETAPAEMPKEGAENTAPKKRRTYKRRPPKKSQAAQ